MNRPPATAALAVSAVLAFAAATPAPVETLPPHLRGVEKAQPAGLLPKVPLHTEYLVAVNKYGQVTGARAARQSKDRFFNLQTYGNALQTYIRTDKGTAVSGVFRLTYNYDPKTGRVRRDVALVHPGGVDPNAPGAVNVMLDAARKEAAAAAAKATKKP